jgi:hypothetical protein
MCEVAYIIGGPRQALHRLANAGYGKKKKQCQQYAPDWVSSHRR